MYSFQPLADIAVRHDGLFIIGMVCATWLIIVLMNDAEEFFVHFFVVTIIMLIGYGVSFHWTSQEPQTFKNEKVIGTFVKFEAEGYKERSGKSYVDRHYTYVVYNVNGNNVLMYAKEGVEYPQTAVLYKN